MDNLQQKFRQRLKLLKPVLKHAEPDFKRLWSPRLRRGERKVPLIHGFLAHACTGSPLHALLTGDTAACASFCSFPPLVVSRDVESGSPSILIKFCWELVHGKTAPVFQRPAPGKGQASELGSENLAGVWNLARRRLSDYVSHPKLTHRNN